MKCRARFVSLKSDSLYFPPRQGKSDSRHEITHTNGNLTVSADEIGAHGNTVLDTSLLACLVIFLCYLHHEEIIKYASLQSSCSSQWKDNIFTLIWILLTIEHLNPGFKARSIQNNVTVLEKRQNQFCFLCSKEDNIRHDGTGRVHSIISQMILSVKLSTQRKNSRKWGELCCYQALIQNQGSSSPSGKHLHLALSQLKQSTWNVKFPFPCFKSWRKTLSIYGAAVIDDDTLCYRCVHEKSNRQEGQRGTGTCMRRFSYSSNWYQQSKNKTNKIFEKKGLWRKTDTSVCQEMCLQSY